MFCVSRSKKKKKHDILFPEEVVVKEEPGLEKPREKVCALSFCPSQSFGRLLMLEYPYTTTMILANMDEMRRAIQQPTSQVCIKRSSVQHRGEPKRVSRLNNRANLHSLHTSSHWLSPHLVDQHLLLQRPTDQRVLFAAIPVATMASCSQDSALNSSRLVQELSHRKTFFQLWKLQN